MLSRVRPSRLCHSCSQDLQILFERGFCGPPVPLTRPRLPLRWRRSIDQRSRHVRSFHNGHAPFRQTPPANSDGRDTDRDNGQIEPGESDLKRQQVLHELEEALGQPIDEAIEKDRDEARPLNRLEDTYANEDETQYESEEPLAVLRNSGVPAEDIAREARVIYGDAVPAHVLEIEELKLYRRLYGEPSRLAEDGAEEVQAIADGEEEARINELLDQQGELVDYDPVPVYLSDNKDLEKDDITGGDTAPVAEGGIDLDSKDREDFSPFQATETRAREVATLLKGHLVEDAEREEAEEEEDDEEVDPNMRTHPFTQLGRFRTNPRSLILPQEQLVEPVQDILSTFSNKHLKEMCEKTFGGPGLPDSPLTPLSGRARPQVPVPLEASQHAMGEMEANAFITANMPPVYAAITSVLVETRKRLGTTWLTNLLAKDGGPRVLDAGAGGAGILAWREIVQAHWKTLHSSDKEPVPSPPETKAVVLTGSDSLRHRAARLLDNTTFIPRLPDYIHTRDVPTLEDDRPTLQRKQFDVIIAPHTLFPLKEDYLRKNHVQNLWSMLSSEGGVLILIEKGIPRGFEAIGAARELLLERYIAVPEGKTTEYTALHKETEDISTRETGMIIAPCTNHERCPMYKVPGVSKGRKDICSFQQRYIRPGYLQHVLGAKDRNHDDVDFSYISMMKGEDLRQRQIQSWSGLEDSLSAPVHPEPQLAAEDYASWVELSSQGFEDVLPGFTPNDIPAPFTNAGKPPSTFPSAHNLPRVVYAPMKRHGHVILDMCTPRGEIERWTVPRSFGAQAYRDARKSRWGDLWALGAKTQIPRNLRLGGENTKEAKKARGRKERLAQQAQDLLEKMHDEKMEEMEDMKTMAREIKQGRFLDEDAMDDMRKTTSVSKPGKIKRAKSAASGVETFSMEGDFDMDKINPPLFPTKKQTPADKSSRRTNPNAFIPSNMMQDDEDDLTFEERANLAEWEQSLQSGNAGKVTGARPIRAYSKFAPMAQKRVARKGGRVGRAKFGK